MKRVIGMEFPGKGVLLNDGESLDLSKAEWTPHAERLAAIATVIERGRLPEPYRSRLISEAFTASPDMVTATPSTTA
jgi:hypothetical protein